MATNLRTTTQVNGKVGNLTPARSETPQPIVTKICVDDYVEDHYRCANFHHDTITPFAPKNAKMRIMWLG